MLANRHITILLTLLLFRLTGQPQAGGTTAVSLSSKISQLHRSIHERLERSDDALQLAREQLLLCGQHGDALQKARALLDLSLCFRYENKLDSAFYFERRCLANLGQVASDTLAADAYANMGNLFFKRGSADSAVFFQLKSLKLREKLNIPADIVNSLYSLGSISNQVGDTAKARYYFTSCYEKAGDSKVPELLALAGDGMASYYYSIGNYAKSIDCYQRSADIYLQLRNYHARAVCLLNLGSLYDENGLSRNSIASYEEALQLFERERSLENIVLCHTNIGVTLYDMGEYNRAASHLKKAEALALQLGMLEIQQYIYESLSDSYRQKGRHDSALVYFKKFSQVKDSLLGIEKIKNINELQEAYGKERREAEITSLKEQQRLKDAETAMHKKRNELLAITCALLGALAVMTFLIFRQRARNAKALSEKRINEIIREQELKSISGIMEGQESERKRIAEDLHDRLGSMLATIKLHFNAMEHKMDHLEVKSLEQYNRANKLLDEVCDEVRKIAHNMESGVLVNFGLVHALTDLKEALQQTGDLAISISSFGMGERLSADIEISVYRIIQELISNVIKHAAASEVSIDLNRSENQLTVIFSDNGKGYTDDVAQARNGMGLKNILSRITKLGGKFYVDSGKKNGTTNIIEIPLSDDKDPDS